MVPPGPQTHRLLAKKSPSSPGNEAELPGANAWALSPQSKLGGKERGSRDGGDRYPVCLSPGTETTEAFISILFRAASALAETSPVNTENRDPTPHRGQNSSGATGYEMLENFKQNNYNLNP